MTANPAPRFVGRYALFGEIAAGGMAVVHFGRLLGDAGFSRTVAIKRLHGHLSRDPELAAMLLDEARMAARVTHPHVVPTLDVVTADGDLVVVMEYVHGETLARLLRAARARSERPPLRVVTAICAGVLHGLHAAHEATSERGEALGIVHRDVSPQNVIVGRDGVARVLDFGIAKATSRSQVTRDGRLRGKVGYMAVEQLMGGVIDRQTDVYAAAVVTWEALTARRLFDADGDMALSEQVKNAPVPPPSEWAPDLPPALDEVVLRGLSRDRTKRFANARDMALAIEACGTIATPSEVGAWVEQIAGDALRERAAALASVEAQSTPEALAGTTSSEPVVSSSRRGAVEDEAPTVEIASPSAPRSLAEAQARAAWEPPPAPSVAAETSRRPRRSRAMAVMYAVSLVLGFAVAIPAGAFFVLTRPRAAAEDTNRATLDTPAPPVAARAPDVPTAAQVAARAPDVPSVVPLAAPLAPSSDSALPRASSPGASAPLAATPPPRAALRPAPRAPAPPRPAATADACDPPFTVDERGIRHIKRECVGR